MAAPSSSSPSNNLNSNPSPPFSPSIDPNSSHNTTFVQADPSNFRAVVQSLTGAAAQKPPVTNLAGKVTNSGAEMGPRRQAFKLHERRQNARKLEIKLFDNNNNIVTNSSRAQRSPLGFEVVMASPISTLDFLTRGNSPRTPMSPLEEEEKAIAEKGFYLHPSPLTTPRGSDPPELLPLFPLK